MSTFPKYTGLIAAPFTPMTSGGEVELDTVDEVASFLKANGVRGAFVCGSTGEGASLTRTEKQAVMAAWSKHAASDFPVMALVGGDCVADARALMQHAQELRLQAVAVVPPTYFSVSTVAQLVDYCAHIASAVPAMPVYYYHIPVLTGAYFSMKSFLQHARTRIPNLAGIKFTHENLMDFRECMKVGDGTYDLLWGRDEALLAALAMGAKGAVGSTYNYAAPLFIRLMQAFEAGELETARALQDQAIEFISLLGKYGGMGTGKAFMKLVGMDCGAFRPPIQNLTPAQLARLKQDLKRIDFFSYCNQLPQT